MKTEIIYKGETVTVEWEEPTIVIESSGVQGPKGDTGEPGYTPVKGVDYFDGQPGKDGQDGQPGRDGQDGAPGQDGQDGVSPTITVTDITGGHRVTITEASGAHSFDVMDGDKGDKGDKGDPGEVSQAQMDAVADDVSDLKRQVDGVATNFPPGAKSALLSCFEHVAWVDDQGQTYYNALYDALYNTVWPVTNTLSNCYTSNAASEITKGAAYSATITANAGYNLTGATVSIVMGGTDITATAYNAGIISIPAVNGALVITVSAAAKTITGISAVYTQSGTVYIGDDLDGLKSDLVVTATYSDSSTETIPAADYTLSGDLLDASSTITVTFGTATTTFSVAVTPHVPSGYTEYQYVKYIGAAVLNTTAAVPYLITTAEYANLNALTVDFDIAPVEAKSAATAIIGGNVSNSGNTDTVEVYGRTDTQRISAFTHGTALGIDGIPDMQVGNIVHIRLEPGNMSPAKLSADALSVDGAWTNTNTVQKAIGLFGRYHGSRGTVIPFVAIGALKLYNVSDDSLAGAYYPCVRTADNVIGYYDTVSEAFYTASNIDCVTVDNANCRYAVGMWGE